jgi:hypothetical protein
MKQDQFGSQSSLLGMFDNDFEKILVGFGLKKCFDVTLRGWPKW